MKERFSNFEMLRIVSMSGIIAMHYFTGHLGGMAQEAIFPNFTWFFSQLIYSLSIPLVNCFVLLTGFFLIDKFCFNIRKVIELLTITMFYGVLGFGIGVISGVTEFSGIRLFYSLFLVLEYK